MGCVDKKCNRNCKCNNKSSCTSLRYNGPDNDCIGIKSGDLYEEVFSKLADYTCKEFEDESTEGCCYEALIIEGEGEEKLYSLVDIEEEETEWQEQSSTFVTNYRVEPVATNLLRVEFTTQISVDNSNSANLHYYKLDINLINSFIGTNYNVEVDYSIQEQFINDFSIYRQDIAFEVVAVQSGFIDTIQLTGVSLKEPIALFTTKSLSDTLLYGSGGVMYIPIKDL